MLGFKALLDAWRGRETVSRMFGQFQQMLDDAGSIFRIVCDTMAGKVPPESAGEQVRTLDKQVNRAERAIRRQVVEHLVANPGTDVPACLVLMSIVKDAERLGDYARDTFYAWQTCRDAIGEPAYAPTILKIESEVARLMADTRKALAESDEALANDIMARENGVKTLCDDMLIALTRDTLSSDRTVNLAIISRYFRRLAAHTANIASSVVNPVEWLDYKSKKPSE